MSTVSSLLEDGRPEPKGAVLFTGPDGIGDYRVNVEEQYYVGHSCMSTEASSNTGYISRAAPDAPHPPPKTARVGEIGWGIPCVADNSLLKTGNQIMLEEFRQVCEDRYSHRYQDPYYPPPQRSMVVNADNSTTISDRLFIERKIKGNPDELSSQPSSHSSTM